MSQADPSLTTPAPASEKNPARAPVTPAGDDTAAATTHAKTRHHGHRGQHAAHRHAGSRPGEKDWRKTLDHGLGVFICLGHIVGATLLLAEHLF